MGPTDIVLNDKSLFLNSKNSSISFMSTTIDSSEVTLASSQTKETTCINSSLSSPASSTSNSLSNSIDNLYSPELLSTLSINTPPLLSPKSITNLTLSTTFNTFSTTSSSNTSSSTITSTTTLPSKPLFTSLSSSITPNSFSLNFNISDFNVYYPPPLNISDDEESNANNINNNGLSNFISNKRKSPYLLRGEKKPSRCSECNRVILKYIVSVNGKKHHNNIFQKSSGFKCSQCQNAICDKCFITYKNNTTNTLNNNNNNSIDLKPISTSSINLISCCNSCINNNNNNNTKNI
ncbi:expressed protein [Dictyostelium purpureum]|uniref:Expressed protein n=1 Tax=Dictyostelium purpureum TaxID=5786 RepID=F0ZGL5_DICPU|nr:uncharacterized protein DICPUDRAFT_91736 [Dictyostelium purpureum]EGC36925.1 expressed protein [Dictyostelium purpureum]|eukprot:XP_003286568.1 expressed protein [Dictyostelium purpureum]